MPQDLLALLTASGPRLLALLTRLTLSPDIAEELMQELFLKLSRSASFRQASDPTAYAFRSAIHLALDARRQRPRTFDLPSSLPALTIDPAEALQRREQAHQLLHALGQLSPQAQEAATLHFIEQHDYEEVARVMNKSQHQVRGLCQDALRQLREKLNAPKSREKCHG